MNNYHHLYGRSHHRTAVMTTAHRASDKWEPQARELARELGIPFVKRGKLSIAKIQQMEKVDAVWALGSRLELHLNGQEYFFHPGMAAIRIKRLLRGEHDPLIKISQVTAGDQILDCTVGFAADATVLAYGAGEAGLVRGIESDHWLSFLVKYGLGKGYPDFPILSQLMQRISIEHADHMQVLTSLPDNSYDIVFFDPMFRHTVTESAGIDLIRALGNDQPLTVEAIKQAVRVAKKRVILKERFFSSEFQRLGFTKMEKGAMNVAYGFIDAKCTHE